MSVPSRLSHMLIQVCISNCINEVLVAMIYVFLCSDWLPIDPWMIKIIHSYDIRCILCLHHHLVYLMGFGIYILRSTFHLQPYTFSVDNTDVYEINTGCQMVCYINGYSSTYILIIHYNHNGLQPNYSLKINILQDI